MDKPNVFARLAGSRKVWVALTAVVLAGCAILGAPADKAAALAATVGALGSAVVLAIGIEDAGRGGGPTPPSLNGLLLAAGLGLLVATAGGCNVPASYLAADRATLDAVAPEYDAYIDADSRLTLDQRRRRHRTVDTWRFRIDQAEGKAAGP